MIGAGALGLTTALHCAMSGRSVAVVERHTAGSQASGRAAGLFKSVQADELRTRLARRSITKAVTFADWAGMPLAVARPGSFLIARTDRLTVVDLLSHRSGLPRHDLVWLGHPDRSRAEVVRRLRFLPLSKDLRQAFQYCNLGYLVAGYAVEVLSGTPLGGLPAHPAADAAGDGPLEPVGRRHDRRPGPCHGLRTPAGRRQCPCRCGR